MYDSSSSADAADTDEDDIDDEPSESKPPRKRARWCGARMLCRKLMNMVFTTESSAA